MKDRMTKLPVSVRKILRNHNAISYRISQWLTKLTGKQSSYFDTQKHFMERTAIDIKIRHDNDYVEMGPLDDDPEGKMFHIITEYKATIEFIASDISRITDALEAFSDEEVEVEGLENVSLEFYDWERKLSAKWDEVGHNKPVLTLELVFEIHHSANK